MSEEEIRETFRPSPEMQQAILGAVKEIDGVLDRLRERAKVIELGKVQHHVLLPEVAVWTVLSTALGEHLWRRAFADGRTVEQALERADRYLKSLVDTLSRALFRIMVKNKEDADGKS